MSEQDYDPKLKEAMAEIRAVLHKHDISGFVSLASPTHVEYGLFIEKPSWSMVKWNDDGTFVFQVRKAHPERTDQTAHMLYGIRDTSKYIGGALDTMLELLESQVDVDHVPMSEHNVRPDYRE